MTFPQLMMKIAYISFLDDVRKARATNKGIETKGKHIPFITDISILREH